MNQAIETHKFDNIALSDDINTLDFLQAVKPFGIIKHLRNFDSLPWQLIDGDKVFLRILRLLAFWAAF